MASDFFINPLSKDLDIVGGDFVVKEAEQQNIELIITSKPGDWKQHPILGVGIYQFMHGVESPAVYNDMIRAVRVQLEYDGLTVNTITAGNGIKLQIDAER